MSQKMNLIGKTISGVVATNESEDGIHRIWMLQFTDGSHVEFVSPGARRQLRKLAGVPASPARRRADDPQMALNVA